jgi:hypothetical protein
MQGKGYQIIEIIPSFVLFNLASRFDGNYFTGASILIFASYS